MDQPHVQALPAHPEPQEIAKLPLPFRPFDPNAKAEAGAVPVNGEGFVTRWLVFGPIPLGDKAGDHAGALSKEWIPGQKGLRPSQHEKASVGPLELRWEVAESNDYFLDLSGAENALTLAATYVHSEEDVKDAFLLTGSDDSAAWWLNGEEVQRYVGGRGVAKDNDRTAKPVSLKKGCNLLVAAVANGGGPGGACARFVTKDNQPLLKLKTGAEPK
jgi:hypothetical protein